MFSLIFFQKTILIFFLIHYLSKFYNISIFFEIYIYMDGIVNNVEEDDQLINIIESPE